MINILKSYTLAFIKISNEDLQHCLRFYQTRGLDEDYIFGFGIGESRQRWAGVCLGPIVFFQKV